MNTGDVFIFCDDRGHQCRKLSAIISTVHDKLCIKNEEWVRVDSMNICVYDDDNLLCFVGKNSVCILKTTDLKRNKYYVQNIDANLSTSPCLSSNSLGCI